MSEIAYHIERNARAHGYNIMLCNSSHDINLEEQVFELLMRARWTNHHSPLQRRYLGRLKKHLSKVPTVFVSENLRDLPESYVAVIIIGECILYGIPVFDGSPRYSVLRQAQTQQHASAARRGVQRRLYPIWINAPFLQQPLFIELHTARIYAGKAIVCHKAVPYGHIRRHRFSCAGRAAGGGRGRYTHTRGNLPARFDNIHYTACPKFNTSTIEQPENDDGLYCVEMLGRK